MARSLTLHIAGLLLSAGVVALLSSVSFGLRGFNPAFYIALAHACLIGLPLYLILRATRPLGWQTAVIGGFVIGALPVGLLTLGSVDQASIGGVATVIDGTRTAAGWMQYLTFVAGAGMLGVFGALAFGLTVQSTLPTRRDGATDESVRRAVWRWRDGVPVLIAGAFIFVLIKLPGSLEDKSCHNPLRGGGTSIAPVANARLSIARSDWEAFHALTKDFARRQGWSYRGDIRSSPQFDMLSTSICEARGTQIMAIATRGGGAPDQNIAISLYQPQGGLSWRSPFKAYYGMLTKRWPGRISLENNMSERIDTPPWLAEPPQPDNGI